MPVQLRQRQTMSVKVNANDFCTLSDELGQRPIQVEQTCRGGRGGEIELTVAGMAVSYSYWPGISRPLSFSAAWKTCKSVVICTPLTVSQAATIMVTF